MATAFEMPHIIDVIKIYPKPTANSVMYFNLTGPLQLVSPTVAVFTLSGAPAGIYMQRRAATPAGLMQWPNVPPGDYEVIVFGNGVYRSEVFGPVMIP